MGRLENQINEIAKESGAALVGIASSDRLDDAPPSGNPDYILPTTRSIISFAIPLDRNTLRDFLGKKDWLSHCVERKRIVQILYSVNDRLVDFLRSNGFEATGVDINNSYRTEPGAKDVTEMTEFIPDFSHRYGAVAAGIGRLGWSGNVLTPEYGALVELGTVLTSAELKEDSLLKENPCDRCKLCTAVCPVEMISSKETVRVRIAGITEEIAKKRPNTCCWIGCTGYQGLAPNKKWSNWSPYRLDYPLPQEKIELDTLCIRLQKADPQMHLEQNSFTNYREAVFNTDWFFNTVCGNCRSVCWKKREDREKNRHLVVNSGIVALNPDGEHIATNNEVIELDTPFNVRVAVLKKEYQKALASKISVKGQKGITPMDTEVLSSVFKRGAEV